MIVLIPMYILSFITAYVVTQRFKNIDSSDITLFMIPVINTIILIAYIIDNIDTNISKLFKK